MKSLLIISGIASSFFCFIAGLFLLLTSGTGQSWMEAIAHGMGIYFLGKAFFTGPALWAQAKKFPDQISRNAAHPAQREEVVLLTTAVD